VARALIIANPRARGGRVAPAGPVLLALTRAGWSVDAVEASEPAVIRRLASAAVADGRELVVAIGGDGTVIEAAMALIGTGVPLGVVPGGTGNLLARNLRIPLSPAGAAKVVANGRPRQLDVGRVDWVAETRCFAIACGTGFDARVLSATDANRKRRWGRIAYVGTALALTERLRNVRHEITVDGERLELDAAEILIANVGEIVPGIVRPRLPIAPDDGLLDVIVLRAGDRVEGLRGVWEALGQAAPGLHPGGRLYRARAREIRVEAAEPQPVELDGDVHGETPFSATVIPGAISVLVPR